MIDFIDEKKELQQLVANCSDPELLAFAQHVREAGARLVAKLPDGSEFELSFPEPSHVQSQET
jgi:hypothetical protein